MYGLLNLSVLRKVGQYIMSDNYKYYSENGMIDCQSFKACYQICRQLKRHGFEKTYDDYIANTRIISFSKNRTEITVYVYNELIDPLTGHKFSYIDYISKLADRYTRRYK